MKRYINIIIAVSIVTLILPTIVNADDGWATNARIAGGPIYSREEHPDIALEKELLIYKEKGYCKVHFLFKNISNKPVSAKAGFPVEFIVPFDYVTPDPAGEILGKIFGKEHFEEPDRAKPKARIINTNKRLILEKNEFEDININAYWEGLKWIYNITIIQDDKDINVDSVLVEGKITTGDTAYIQFHFLHELSFKPSSFSHVTVEYSMNSVVGYFMQPSPPWGIFYHWHYVLRTGRTWKGPIDVIYLAIPDHLTPNLPKAFTRIGNFKKETYYMAQQYEPSVNDKIELGYLDYGDLPSSELFALDEMSDVFLFDTLSIIQLAEPKKTAQSFVVLKNASSYLPQRTWVNSIITMDVPFNNPFWNIFDFYQASANTVEWAKTT